jgi:hypothetical protein
LRATTLALIAAVLVAALSIFQMLLAAGAPLGRAAFGGEKPVLSKKLRVASAASAVVFVAACYVILARSGLLGGTSRSSTLIRVGIWVLVAMFGLSTFANVASRSHWERRVMAPVALVLVACCLTIALS